MGSPAMGIPVMGSSHVEKSARRGDRKEGCQDRRRSGSRDTKIQRSRNLGGLRSVAVRAWPAPVLLACPMRKRLLKILHKIAGFHAGTRCHASARDAALRLISSRLVDRPDRQKNLGTPCALPRCTPTTGMPPPSFTQVLCSHGGNMPTCGE